MTAAARHARSGAVTVAARQAITTAGPCEPGDVLGVVEGDFAVVGQDLFDGRRRRDRAACSAAAASWSRVIAGAGGDDLARRCARAPGERRTRPSTCSSTTAARSATRCSSGWSDGGSVWDTRLAGRGGRQAREAARASDLGIEHRR